VEIPGLPDFPGYPDWHPTEDVITFQTGVDDPFLREGTPPGLFTMGIDGSGLTQLLADRSADEPWIALPSWTADGTGIIVTLVIAKGKHSLAVVARDGSRLDDIGGSDPVMGAHAHQQRGAAAP
jgi:Tol biopolymer transport system component